MAHRVKAPRVTARAKQIMTSVGLLDNPYLTALADGSMSLEHFRATQEQFGIAVTFFSRPMAALIARMELPGDRLGILANILEEHGDLQPHAFHHNTFRKFLASIGSYDAQRLDTLTPCPAIHAHNSVLISVCALQDVEIAISCVGFHEHAFAGISAAIGSAVVKRGWVAEDDLVHYALHAEIDEQHAEEFFLLVEPDYDDPRIRSAVDRGLRLGAYNMSRLYTDLYTLDG
ncbi:hypothetical protein LRC484719_49510 [Mycobacterium riyadhense]|uniref:TenA family transcriptional regulator n=1 Tax=Mycobacterium riyadhense TaxID=486698 RepID=UPI00195DB752|nr:iron-containing redox enzyme family protein [Mycobacterium riyadhense]